MILGKKQYKSNIFFIIFAPILPSMTLQKWIEDRALLCYKKYMEFVVDRAPSYKQFVNNMQEKMEDPEFTKDMQSLLRPGITLNASDAYPLIYETFIDKMEGKRE